MVTDSHSPLAAIAVYLHVSELPIQMSLKSASADAAQFVTNPSLIFKVKELYEELRKMYSGVFAAHFVKSRMAGYETDIKRFDPEAFRKRVAELDQKRTTLLLLQIADNLRKAIDWGSFQQYAKAKDQKFFDNLMYILTRLVKRTATVDILDFLQKPDVTTFNLEYYRAHDVSGSASRAEKLIFFSHLFTLQKFFEEAVDLIHNTASSEDISAYKNRILKSIQFPPQYYRAGMAIISEFQKILRQRYRDLEVKFSIEQDGLTVRLIIDTPDGSRTVIEEVLDKYLNAVTGRIPVEEFAVDPLEAMDLRHMVDMLQLTVKHQQNLLEFAGGQVRFLQNQLDGVRANEQNLIGHIGELIEQKRDDAQEWRATILSHIEASHGALRSALLYLQEAAEQNKGVNDDNLRKAVEIIRAQRPGFFDEINAFLLKSMASGVVGNAFYDWLGALLKSLPR